MYIDLSPKGLAELRERWERSPPGEIRVSFDVLMSLVAEIEKLRVEAAQLRRSI
jgi:hypothetical protein